MLDPVAIHEIAGAALLGGAIILFGAGYALFLALSRLHGSALFSRISLACYAALAASAGGLTVLLNLWGWWLALVCALLAGYFVAPRFIWRLSEAVHGGGASSNLEGRGG
ncbi:MAG: hypothetical protein F4171_00165 [Gammaproteobacteria bacterium]|nr:hypothetical protein [Gammaproteobacteria bacterium]MYG11198.1 hypothetical protein [Gammaproteobacteria bacterium]MYK27346.1 hypothetical protein [Gammaproteobacteria bacterium]